MLSNCINPAASKVLFGWLLLCGLSCTTAFGQRANLDSLTQVVHQADDRAPSISKIVWFGYKRLWNAPDTARLFALRAIALYDQYNITFKKQNAYRLLGDVHRVWSKYTEARSYYLIADSLAIVNNDSLARAMIINDMALNDYYKGNYVRSLEDYLRAKTISEAIKDYEGVAVAYSNIGILYSEQKQYELALESYKQAITIIKSIDEKYHYQLGNAYLNIALTYYNINNLEQAIEYHNLALEVYKGYNDREGEAYVYEGLADVYKARGRHQACTDYSLKAKEIFQSIGNQTGLSAVLATLADNYLQMGQLNYAAQQGREALKIARQINDHSDIAAGARLLTKIFKQQGNYQEALQMQDLHMTYQDSILNEEKARALIGWQTKYETAEKEKANQQLRLETALTQQNNMILTVGIILALGLAISFAFVFFKVSHMRDMLQESNAIKDRLFSVIAHDMRGPVDALSMVLPTLQAGSFNAQERQVIYDELSQRLHSTENMMSNLLKWAGMHMNEVRLKPVKVSLAGIIQEVIELYQNDAEKQQITLAHQGHDYTVNTDPEVIKLVLRNLVNNAMKFTPKQGSIIIVTADNNNKVAVSVRDNGVGMNTDKLRSLLISGKKVTKKGLRGEKGTGLGLLLCRDFLKEIGSVLRFDSTPGKGSTFIFDIPKAS